MRLFNNISVQKHLKILHRCPVVLTKMDALFGGAKSAAIFTPKCAILRAPCGWGYREQCSWQLEEPAQYFRFIDSRLTPAFLMFLCPQGKTGAESKAQNCTLGMCLKARGHFGGEKDSPMREGQ